MFRGLLNFYHSIFGSYWGQQTKWSNTVRYHPKFYHFKIHFYKGFRLIQIHTDLFSSSLSFVARLHILLKGEKNLGCAWPQLLSSGFSSE